MIVVSHLADLVKVMDTLRSPGGCPWDAEQTHTSLLKYLVEESYEVVDAVQREHPSALCEELGDLLLQVVFHARIAQEHPDQPFGIEDVAAGICDKLRRRHPHVFGDVIVSDAAEVEVNWAQIKADEKRRRHLLDDIPRALPALARAAKFVDRLGEAGRSDGPAAPSSQPGPDSAAHGIGAELFALVARSRALGLDPESCLRDHLVRVESAMRDVSHKPDVGTP